MTLRHIVIVGSTILTMALCTTALAQPKLSLNVEKSVTIGLENNRSLHSSRMSVQIADARASEMNASRLPSLKFGGSYARLSDVPPFQQVIPAGTFGPTQQPITFTLSPVVLNNYNLRLSLQQPLFTGNRIQSAYDIADHLAQAAGEDYQRDEAELIYAIKNAYWNLFKAREVKKTVDENVGQVSAHRTDVQHLMDKGLVTTNELLRVQVQLSNAKLMQIDATNNVQLALLALNNILGQPLTTEIELETTSDSLRLAETARPAFDVQALIDSARRNRSEVKAMQYRLQASEEAVTLARSDWYPQLYLTGDYYYARPNQRILPTEDKFRDTWDVNLSMSLDIWNWGATMYQSRQAEAQLLQAKDGLALVSDGVTLEVTQNYLNVNQSWERIGVSYEAFTQANENYRVTNEKFKLGLALNSDMLDAEGALLQTKTLYTQAIVDYQLSQARLQKSIGQ